MLKSLKTFKSLAAFSKGKPTTSNLLFCFPKFCFGAKPAPGKSAPSEPQDPFMKKVQEKLGSYLEIKNPTHIIPPRRQPLDEGDEQEYVPPEKKLYYHFSGLGNIDERVRQGAYVAVEKGGIVYHLFDAERIALGRMCSRIATSLMGKSNPNFRRDSTGYGDVVIVTNAANIKLTGKKALNKVVRYHTGYVGHLKEIPYRKFLWEKPEQLIFRIVSKMLPPNKLRNDHLKKLHIYRDKSHPLTQYLPNFEEKPKVVNEKVKEMMTIDPNNAKVVFETQPGGFEEFKDFKREIDPEITVPFQDRKIRYSIHPEDRKLSLEYAKFLRKIKKYKDYKPKPPKNRDPRLHKDSIYVDSKDKAKKWGLSEMLKMEEGETLDNEP